MDWELFWEVFFISIVVIPLLYIWGFAICDLFMRPDLSGLKKVIWLLAIIFFPVVGTLAYFVTHPVTSLVGAHGREKYLPGVLASLDSLHDAGDLSDSEYERRRAEVMATTYQAEVRGRL